MSLLMCVLWAACTGTLWGHVHRLPLFRHAPKPLIPRETFMPVPYKSPLPQGLHALLIPTAGPQRPGGPQPSPPGPVDVWCGLRQVSVRVDRVRLRHWSIPGLFRFSSCGVSAASSRYLYFHRGLDECGKTAQVVGGQLVYTYTLTYMTPHHGFVLRAPPLKMVLSCHYNRFHYSYRVGFQPQAQPSTFLKSVRSQTSFSLTVCNSQWEVLPPEHHFVLGEPVYFIAKTGALRAGERLYVDSCHVTSSKDPGTSPRLDIITNFGCMVDSLRADSSSHFNSRGPRELRFSVDSLLFSSQGQMLSLHCSLSVGLLPSPSSKSCTYNRAMGRWLELEASPSVCSCCEAVCVDLHGAHSTTVSSASWNMAKSLDQQHQGDLTLKRGLSLTEELHQDNMSLKSGELHQGAVSLNGQGLTKELHHGPVSLNGQGLTKELHRGTVSLKSGEHSSETQPLVAAGQHLTKELHQGDVSLNGQGRTEELHQGAVSLKSGEHSFVAAGQLLSKELTQGDVSLKNRGQGRTEELHQGAVSQMSGQGLTKELHQDDVSLKSGGQGRTEELHQEATSLQNAGKGLMEELHQGDVSLKSRGQGLTEELHQGDVSLKSGEHSSETQPLVAAGQHLTKELHQGDVSLNGQGLTKELHHGPVSLKSGEHSFVAAGQRLSTELTQGDVSLKNSGQGLTKELHQGDVSLKSGGQGRTEELHQEATSLQNAGKGLMEELHQGDVSLKSRGQGLTEELHQKTPSLKRAEQGLTKELVQEDHWSPLRGDVPEQDSAVEYTDTQHSSPLFISALTNHTSVQKQSVAAAAANVSTTAALQDQGLVS